MEAFPSKKKTLIGHTQTCKKTIPTKTQSQMIQIPSIRGSNGGSGTKLWKLMVLMVCIVEMDYNNRPLPAGGSLFAMAQNPEMHDVCVIGAGPSGLYSALLLQEKGYDVVVFERESHVGGKTVPYFNSDGSPIIRHLLSVDMDLVLELQQTYPFHVTDLDDIHDANVFLSDPPYTLIPRANLPPISQDTIDAALDYITLLSEPTMLEIVKNAGSNLDVPEELMVPIGEWLATNNLSALNPILFTYVTNFGNGYLDYTPAIYILKIIPPETMQQIITVGLDTWFAHDLCFGMAENVQDLRLKAEVTSLNVASSNGRGRAFSVLKHSASNRSVLCENVILAFNQVEENLQFVHKFNQISKRVLDRVNTLYYYEVIVSGQALQFMGTPSTYLALYTPTISVDQPGTYVRGFTEESDVMVLMATGLDPVSQEDAIATVLEQIQNVFGVTLSETDIVQFIEHDYKPHVNTTTFQEGFYDDLEAIQGLDGIYFVGGLVAFEIVNAVLHSAKDVVENYF